MNLLKNNYNFMAILIAIFILTCFLFWFAIPILSNLCIYDVDDLNSTYDSYPLWREENGRYIANIISRFFLVHIPNLFGIHLQNAVNSIGMVIYIFILSSLFSVVSLFYFSNNKTPITFSFLWLFTGLVFFDYAAKSIFYSTIASFQYGYVLASVFSILFLYFVYKYISEYIENNQEIEYSRKKIIFLSIFAFCAGNSTQIAAYSNFIILILLGILFLVKNNFDIQRTKKELFNKNTITILLSYLAGFMCMVACPGFWIEVSWRHTSSLQQIYMDFIPFVNEFFHIVIIQHLCFYKIIFILVIALIIKDICNKKTIKECIFNTCLKLLPIVGVLTYYFTLILGGQTFPSFDKHFWLIEPFYEFYLLMIFCTVICLLIGELMKNNKHYYNFIILVFVYIIISSLYITNIDHILNKREIFIRDFAKIRQDVYLCEKILMTEVYKDKKIILPETYNKKYNMYSSEPLSRYLPKAYGIELEKDVDTLNDKETMEYFYSIGGTITEEEKNKTDFQKLFDKNFVLNEDNNETNNNNTNI